MTKVDPVARSCANEARFTPIIHPTGGEAERMRVALRSGTDTGAYEHFGIPTITLPDDMPQAALEELFVHGQVMKVTTFAEHMSPRVATHWIAPTEYREAFEELIKEETPMFDDHTEAAYTSKAANLPGYINIQRNEAGDYVVTMRGDQAPVPMLNQGRIVVSEDDWHQLIAQVGMMRPAKPQTVAEIEPVIAEMAAARDAGRDPQDIRGELGDRLYEEATRGEDSPGATAADPLGQRPPASDGDDDA